MSEPTPTLDDYDFEYPSPYLLADDEDELGWDASLHGRFIHYEAPDDAIETLPYEPEEG